MKRSPACKCEIFPEIDPANFQQKYISIVITSESIAISMFLHSLSGYDPVLAPCHSKMSGVHVRENVWRVLIWT